MLVPVLRWIARAWTVGSVGLILAFLAGESATAARITPAQWAGLVFFPAGVCAGLILGWWREGAGGVLTIASLIIFYSIRFVTTGTFPEGWAFLALAAPGVLFLFVSQLERTGAAHGRRSDSRG